MEQGHIVYRILDAVGKLVVCSLLWVLCSLPVVTLGASCTAVYYAAVKAVRRDRDGVFRAFFAAFRQNFKQSTIVHILSLWVGGVPVCLLVSAYAAGTAFGAGEYALIGVLALLVMALALVYPVISRFYHRGAGLLRFVLLVMGRHPWAGIGSLLMLLGGALLVLHSGALLLIVPGGLAFAQSFLLEPVFRKYSAADGNYDLWYGADGEKSAP